MTTARLTKRRNKLEKNAAEVAALITSGSASQADVARMFGCSRETGPGFEEVANATEPEVLALLVTASSPGNGVGRKTRPGRLYISSGGASESARAAGVVSWLFPYSKS